MPSKPVQRVGETDEAYADRIDVWKSYSRAYDRQRYQRDREKRLRYANERYSDPNFREQKRAYARRQYDAPPEGQTCEICGASPGLDTIGRRMLHQDHRHDNNVIRGWLCTGCNKAIAVLDLRFSDPARFAALQAWSSRAAPVVPTTSPTPKKRRRASADPTLFEVRDVAGSQQ